MVKVYNFISLTRQPLGQKQNLLDNIIILRIGRSLHR